MSPIGEHLSRCIRCGNAFICGDCIKYVCDECETGQRPLDLPYGSYACISDDWIKKSTGLAELKQSFDELATAVGWTKERCEQDGDSPIDAAKTLKQEHDWYTEAYTKMRDVICERDRHFFDCLNDPEFGGTGIDLIIDLIVDGMKARQERQ